MADKYSLGYVLRMIREYRRITQEDIDSLTNMGAQHVSEIENNKRTVSMDRLHRMSKALGVLPSSVLSIHEIINRKQSVDKTTVEQVVVNWVKDLELRNTEQ